MPESYLIQVRTEVPANGRSALAAIAHATYDLMLVDLDMPDMNGVEVVASMRAQLEALPSILIVSGEGGAADWQVLASIGASGFLVKPLQLETLGLHVSRLLR